MGDDAAATDLRGARLGYVPRRKRVDSRGIEDLARRYDSVARVADLLRMGVPPSTISYRTRRSGPWQRMLPGVVLMSSGTPTRRQRLVAALKYARAGAVLTGTAALRLYGVPSAASGSKIEVLIPHRRRRLSVGDVAIMRCRRMPTHRWRDGLPCAPPARAVIDATRRMRNIDEVRDLIAAAVQGNVCTIGALGIELGKAHPGGTRLPRLVLREVAAGIRSVAEAKARAMIQGSDLPQPVWNSDLYDHEGRWIARPDGVWEDLGVVLEIDSLTWHLSPAAYRATQARQRRMAKLGLLVIPVAPSDVSTDEAAFLDTLRDALAAARTRRSPLVKVRITEEPPAAA